MTSRMFTSTLLATWLALSGCSSGTTTRVGPMRFVGKASLPLSGDMAPFGQAFREGFESGLLSSRDTTFVWAWE